MWVRTKSSWPVLINLAVLSQINYEQASKRDPRVRLVGTAWEQELLLADCATGDEARAVMGKIGDALAAGVSMLDLATIDPPEQRSS